MPRTWKTGQFSSLAPYVRLLVLSAAATAVGALTVNAAPQANKCCGTQNTCCSGCTLITVLGGTNYYLSLPTKYYYKCGDIPNRPDLSCDDANPNQCYSDINLQKYSDAQCQNAIQGQTTSYTIAPNSCVVPGSSACPPPPAPGGPGDEP